MTSRYYVSPPIVDDHATLTGPEAHHLLHVMRSKPGDEVLLFDGSGQEFRARIERLARSTVELAVIAPAAVDRELPFDLTLAVALPKGDRQAWLVEKATELGVTRLVPLRTERSVADPTAGALERLRRGVIEASKQCGRNRLMEISAACAWSQLVGHAAHAATTRLVAHPGGAAIAASAPAAGAVTAAVGPEGGFTDAEIAEAAAHGWRTIDLGPRLLRVETAAVALASILSSRG